MDLLLLKKRWLALFLPALPTQGTILAFNFLVSAYNEPRRHYHNLEHINACLDYFDDISHLIEFPVAVEAAIWFHDVIYHPMGFGNEKRSAEFARNNLLELGFSKKLVATVSCLIMATAHPSHPHSSDEKYLADIDLAVLGSDSDIFDTYEKNIRREFGWMPGFIYKRQRKTFLKSLLARQSIYHTGYFTEKFEEKALKNIERTVKHYNGSRMSL
jgi:predicted metal-dependent HD superfamily phosphohydrolase